MNTTCQVPGAPGSGAAKRSRSRPGDFSRGRGRHPGVSTRASHSSWANSFWSWTSRPAVSSQRRWPGPSRSPGGTSTHSPIWTRERSSASGSTTTRTVASYGAGVPVGWTERWTGLYRSGMLFAGGWGFWRVDRLRHVPGGGSWPQDATDTATARGGSHWPPSSPPRGLAGHPPGHVGFQQRGRPGASAHAGRSPRPDWRVPRR